MIVIVSLPGILYRLQVKGAAGFSGVRFCLPYDLHETFTSYVKFEKQDDVTEVKKLIFSVFLKISAICRKNEIFSPKSGKSQKANYSVSFYVTEMIRLSKVS